MQKKLTRITRKERSRGISLIEACIVLVVAGLMITTALEAMKQERARHVMDVNNERVSTIKGALASFIGKYDRLPCPARRDLPSNDPLYGKETACSTGGAITGIDRTKEAGPPGWVRVGAVPVRDLGLPDEYISDSWGRLFVYAATEALTAAPVPPATFNVANASVHIVNTTGAGPANINALYAVISPGADGRGAYTTEGRLIATCGNAITQGADFQNCDHSMGANAVFSLARTGTRLATAQHFDDIVAYNTAINDISLPVCGADETMVSPDGVNFTCQPFSQPPICGTNQRLTSNDGVTFFCQDLSVIPACLANQRLTSTNGFDFTCKDLPPPPPPPPPPPALPVCASDQRLISDGTSFSCKTMTLTAIEVFKDTVSLGGGWWGATATCPAGYTVAGGGWNASFIDPLYGRFTGRSGNGWNCRYRVGGGSSMGDCRALCIKMN